MSDHCDTAAWPLVCKKQRLPRQAFRSSIAWLSDSLSTLRGVSYLSTTQDSLPVAGQALLDGIPTRKVPMKGFKFVDYISFPLPKLSWRNCIDFGSLRSTVTRVGEIDLCTFRIRQKYGGGPHLRAVILIHEVGKSGKTAPSK